MSCLPLIPKKRSKNPTDMLTFLQKAWLVIKKWWGLFALLAATILGYFFFRRQTDSFSDQFKKLQDSHDQEIKAIDEARIEEEKAHEANLKKMQETLDAVQEQYDQKEKDLDARKKAEITDLVKQYSDDPDVLAKKLSEATGFQVILPS